MAKQTIFFSIIGIIFSAQAVYGASTEVLAIDAMNGEPIHANLLVQAKVKSRQIVDRKNMKIELGPWSVGEFSSDGQFQLLRGSAFVEARNDGKIITANAKVIFLGKAVVSYDANERSTSALVLLGEAKLVNVFQNNQFVILNINQGATLLADTMIPTVIRSLTYASAEKWLTSYQWNASRIKDLLAQVPDAILEGSQNIAKSQEGHASAKLEKYFPAIIENNLNYYESKDDTLASSNNQKKIYTKKDMAKVASVEVLKPEDAAMISLPNIGVDVDLPNIKQKISEKKIRVASKHKKQQRVIASVTKPKAMPDADPDISQTLERLRRLNQEYRGPASDQSNTANVIFDFSENF